MRAGRIEQVGTPDEVYHSPATPFVFEFLGDVNRFHGQKTAYARPYEIEILLEEDGDDLIAAKVEHVVTRGSVIRVELATGEGGDDPRTIEADLTRERVRDLALEKGQDVFIRATSLRVFEGGQAAE
jgi:sulfate transport system ATP-binding protein